MSRPDWSEWRSGRPYTVGLEEEVMLLDPRDWSLASDTEHVQPTLPEELRPHVTAETQGSVLELATGVHETVQQAAEEISDLRRAFEHSIARHGLRAASAGTHPFARWEETVVSTQDRYQFVYGSMRELARREPTFALHVHVAVPDPESAIGFLNALRGHLPLLLALSVNSPFWQGRDTGLASARTPLFKAFPRVGIPRAFDDYADWRDSVELLLHCDAIPEPTFLWWDARPQPRFGTVEVRIADAQTTVPESAALVALIQSLARLELEEGYSDQGLVGSPEIVEENRFLAARDGMQAELIHPGLGERVPAQLLLEQVLSACAPHARELGCERELDGARRLGERTGAERQRELAKRSHKLPGLMAALAEAFCKGGPGIEAASTEWRKPGSESSTAG